MPSLKATACASARSAPARCETEFFGRAGMPHDYFPDYLTRTAERVAREGYEGFMGGHRVVVPGRPNRILTPAAAAVAAPRSCSP